MTNDLIRYSKFCYVIFMLRHVTENRSVKHHEHCFLSSLVWSRVYQLSNETRTELFKIAEIMK